jgi:hypothetical protein
MTSGLHIRTNLFRLKRLRSQSLRRSAGHASSERGGIGGARRPVAAPGPAVDDDEGRWEADGGRAYERG